MSNHSHYLDKVDFTKSLSIIKPTVYFHGCNWAYIIFFFNFSLLSHQNCPQMEGMMICFGEEVGQGGRRGGGGTERGVSKLWLINFPAFISYTCPSWWINTVLFEHFTIFCLWIKCLSINIRIHIELLYI